MILLPILTAFALSSASASDDAVKKWCGQLSKELLSVKHDRCVNRGWKVETTSPGNHPIPYLYWGKDVPPAKEGDEPSEPRRILVIGAVHGDEISAVSLVFRWMDFLDTTKKDSFLREHRYLFIPLANPDGFFVSPRTRPNGAGVDINRNFSTKDWDARALSYWKSRAGSAKGRYPGKQAASERETQMLQKAINEFRPDLIISVHAPYKLVDHDGPILFPDLKSPLPVKTLGAYPGSLGTYAGIERGIPVVTPELPSARTLPDLKAVEQLFLFIMKAQY